MTTNSDRGGNAYLNLLRKLSGEGLDSLMTIIEEEIFKDPASWEAWGAKADVLYLQNRYEKAIEYCDRSLSINPSNALVWNTKGNALYMLKRYGEAIDCYNKAIELDHLLARAWYNKKLALDVLLKNKVPRITPVDKTRSDIELSDKD